jgi:hypothetical protein
VKPWAGRSPVTRRTVQVFACSSSDGTRGRRGEFCAVFYVVCAQHSKCTLSAAASRSAKRAATTSSPSCTFRTISDGRSWALSTTTMAHCPSTRIHMGTLNTKSKSHARSLWDVHALARRGLFSVPAGFDPVPPVQSCPVSRRLHY